MYQLINCVICNFQIWIIHIYHRVEIAKVDQFSFMRAHSHVHSGSPRCDISKRDSKSSHREEMSSRGHMFERMCFQSPNTQLESVCVCIVNIVFFSPPLM